MNDGPHPGRWWSRRDPVEPLHAEPLPLGADEPSVPDLKMDAVDPAEYRRRRASADLYARTLWGAAFCALGCAITAGVGGYFEQHPGLTAGVLLAFGLLNGLRRAHRPPQDSDDAAATRRWVQRHWWLVLVSGLVWCGFLLAVGMIEQRASTTFFVVAMVTVAFTSASAESLALDRRWALTIVSIQQLPALGVLWFTVPGLRSICLVLLSFWIYQALHVFRRAREYDTQMAIECTLLNSRAEVERLSRQDSLTGLSNRRDYEAAFDAIWHHAARERSDLALLVIDLDHFKSINDRCGHSGGDACLRHVANVMRDMFLRSSDLLARIGGEEFAVVLPQANAAQAELLAQRFCVRLAETPCECDGQQINVTASIGVCTVQWALDTSPQASFRRADAACYAAKQQGRNRVVGA